MVITEVRIKLVEENNERLMAFCSITLDNAFVIRDLKIIEGTKGLFVAMPSRKLTDRCTHCGSKNHLRSRFCNNCGHKLDENRAARDVDGRAKLHADIAHPINSACREVMQAAIIKAFSEEKERAKLPGLRLHLRRLRRRRFRYHDRQQLRRRHQRNGQERLSRPRRPRRAARHAHERHAKNRPMPATTAISARASCKRIDYGLLYFKAPTMAF